MATSTRESRRRKILERGSDRLAFITGQVQNLPPQSHDQTDSNPPPPLVPHGQDPPPNFSSQPAVSPDVHEKASSPVLLKHDLSFDADQSQTSAYNGGIGEGSISHRGGIGIEPSKDPALDASGEVNPLPVPLDDQSSFISTSGVAQHSETRARQHNFFTHRQISSAIDASENTRLLCSVIMAILVVLSHLGFPLLENRFLWSIISFRPLYFILLTDLTVVIARLLFHDHGGSGRAISEENKNASTDDYNWAEQLSKTLEVGLVAKKVIDAVLMDCSVYLTIVICCLSFT
ncbi:uncharacterized protein LOC111286714 [Durio zibethinus]|uniref:Uncharacterized protein LOC111286714 n=1 Tax=Durio zibethinus TaxID=66656 RepID=A0A6P5XX06_DURZI|nr:uncharacterized protein LOC111286714 [Durio zibethinus]